MISDDIPADRLAADDDIVGPYFLWRLLIDHRFQGRGYGAATVDAIADYVAAKPNGETLLTSCAAGEGSPQPFYLRHGFVLTGERKWGEDLLRLDLASRRRRPNGGPG
jgi:diamine N-acetyltransferase